MMDRTDDSGRWAEASRVVLPVYVWRDFTDSLDPLFEASRSQLTTPRVLGQLAYEQHEDVVSIKAPDRSDRHKIPVMLCGEDGIESFGAEVANTCLGEGAQRPALVATWDGRKDSLPEVWEWDPSKRRRGRLLERSTYDLSSEVYSRVEGIFETRKLAGRGVAVVGVGSLGSFCADELVRCGVGRFVLADFDRLEPHNVVRHACDLRDLGRFKTHAVADKIRAVNPLAQVVTHEVDVLKTPTVARELVAASDVVLVCTDNNASRFMINEFSLEHGVPAVYAGAYERAFGGHVLRVIPGETPCYECVIGGVIAAVGPIPEPVKGKVAYLGQEDEDTFVAEPGLGVDARFIALIQAKMALLTLLRGEDTTLDDYPADFVLWGNRKEWIFPAPLYAQFANTTFRKDCSACGATAVQTTS